MKMLIAALFGGCLWSSSAFAQQEYWTTYFIRDQVAAPDVVQRCKVSLDQNALESHLREVGGPWKQFKPSINWAEDITIIIAPNKDYTDYELAFKHLRWEPNKYFDGITGWFVLHWGWNAVPKQDTGASRTVGSQRKPKILIIVVKRYLHKPTNRLMCQEDN